MRLIPIFQKSLHTKEFQSIVLKDCIQGYKTGLLKLYKPEYKQVYIQVLNDQIQQCGSPKKLGGSTNIFIWHLLLANVVGRHTGWYLPSLLIEIGWVKYLNQSDTYTKEAPITFMIKEGVCRSLVG